MVHLQEAGLTLGHTRLSIIDPTAQNDQPFQEGRVVLAFNGEIFNYPDLREQLAAGGRVFRTQGDSEVLAAGYLAWGPELFRRIKGMYAIALYDRALSRLYLSRDLFGIKPLYVSTEGGALRFASELKWLVGDLRLDPAGFCDLLAFGYHFGPRSLYQGITAVPPGEVFQYDDDGTQLTKTCWSAKSFESILASAPRRARLGRCLEDSVRRHLIADAPLATMLSGGLDSSIVTVLARQHAPTLSAYSSTFFPDGDAEIHYSALLARHSRFDHHIVRSDATDLEAELDAITWYLEEPIGNSAAFNSFSLGRRLREDGYKVALVGEGSDELFAGYPWHALALGGRPWSAVFDALREKRAIVPEAPPYLTAQAGAAMQERMAEQREIFLSEMQADVGSPLNRFLLFDMRHQLVSSQLQRVDRMFMAHGVEARVPFLYDDVFGCAFRTSADDRLDVSATRLRTFLRRIRYSPRQDKLCLARAFRHLLPEEILGRPKFGKGGSVNVGQAPMMRQWAGLFRKVLRDDDYAVARDALAGWIDWGAIDPQRVTRREQMFLTMLAMNMRHMARTLADVKNVAKNGVS